ncbi:DUF3108 domain-containing protein [Luteimonas pelagia]
MALAGTAIAAKAMMKPFTAQYAVFYEGKPQGEGTMRLSQAGGSKWEYRLDIRGTAGLAAVAGADIAQRTTFEVVDGQWRPISSSDSSKMLFKSSTTSATYDWSAGVARWTGDVKPERAGPVRLKRGDLDAMLVNLALPRDLSAGRPLHYRLVDNGRAKPMHYEVTGEETVSVGGRDYAATRVVSQDGDKQIVAWLVDDLPVPARILQRKDGKDALDLRILSVR